LNIDVKQGLNAFVIGPHSLRPDGVLYQFHRKPFSLCDVPPIKQEKKPSFGTVVSTSNKVRSGTRHSFLMQKASEYIEYVDSKEELLQNLLYDRDTYCTDPSAVSMTEVEGIANWWWDLHFDHAVRVLVTDLWKGSKSYPVAECRIDKRSGYYSENPRYRDKNLTYKQTMAAYDGLTRLGMIEETACGYFDQSTLQGNLTRYVARDELLERLIEIEGHPALLPPYNNDAEIIILRDKIDGKKINKEYEDTPATNTYRSNLQRINKCLLGHWADLELRDSELPILADRITKHETKEPIDFSQRTLVRIFSNGSFKEGGRFYRGWWQNVPSEYRKYITIDEKRTAEVDFSQLNPHLLYISNYKELGSEDAYSRVLDGEHRDIVKQAFNAMVQASGPLNRCPDDIDLTELDIGWNDLKKRILAAHKPIADLFFKGVGNKLQFQDSCIAERVMLQFVDWDAPALPVHDSFIVHHGYAETGDIEEIMRRSFYEEIGEHISKVDSEVLTWHYRKDDTQANSSDSPSIDQILNADNDVSQWRERHNMWYSSKHRIM